MEKFCSLKNVEVLTLLDAPEKNTFLKSVNFEKVGMSDESPNDKDAGHVLTF